MRKQQANLASLPHDISKEILLLLALESLLALKCVSKQLKNLINSPKFVKLYKNKSTVSFLHEGNLYFLFISNQDNNKMRSRRIPIGQLNRDRYRDRDWNSYDLLLESSNKRVCVKTANHDFLVYDLLTGDSYKVIPDFPLQQDSCRWLGYGFGYDPHADDYRIVLLVSSPDGDNYYDIHQCNLVFEYSFRNGGWKSFKSFPDAAYYWGSSHSAAYCFNGVLHWVVDKLIEHVDGDDDDYDDDDDDDDDDDNDDDDEKYDQVVVTLDLHTGRLAEIALPEPYNDETSPNLAELDGHLCFCDYGAYGEYGDSFGFDVWVMEEYGVEESWTKLIRINDHQYLRLKPFEYWTTPPVLYSKDGGRKTAVCLSHDSKLRVYEYELCEGDEMRCSFTQHYLGEGEDSTEVQKEIQGRDWGHGGAALSSSLARLLNLH